MQKTKEQEEFCQAIWNTDDSIQLNAVAGSGKTTTLMAAINGLPSTNNVLLLAFNKKIAEELAKRAPAGTNVSTLNSLGHRAWGNYLRKKLFLNSYKIGSIVSELLKEEPADSPLRGAWIQIKDLVIKARVSGITHKHFADAKGILNDTDENWHAIASNFGLEIDADILRTARKALKKSIELALAGEIDFDDQLYMPVLFRANFAKFDTVFVDEAQDLSGIQHYIIKKSCARRLVLIGDPKQAIYGFRGASNNSMQELSAAFNATEMNLTYTFRCPKTATALAQRYVPHIKAADANPEGKIEKIKSFEPEDIRAGATVLCRNIAPLIKLGFQLIKINRPAYVVGRDIGAPIIKAAKALPVGNEIVQSIIQWQALEWSKTDDLEKRERIQDTTDALLFTQEVTKVKTKEELITRLQELFSRTTGSIALSTIHRAKGLEFPDVYILDFWRMPQQWILKLVKENPQCDWLITQESNLAYIALTRTQDRLTFISYKEDICQ